jgi:hypothetical protein
MKENYIPGEGCECLAHSEAECGCDADWTPREVYELREQRDRLAEALSGLINYTNTLELHLSTPFHAFKDNEHPNMQSAKNELAAVKGVSDDR